MTALKSRYLGEIAEEVNDRVGADSATPVYAVTKHAGFVPSAEYFKKRVHSSNTSKYKRVRNGEFAYATIHLDEGSIGLLEGADEAAISPMYTVFKVDELEVWQPFLIRLLKSPRMLAKYPALGSGTVHRRKSIPFRRLADLKLDLPEVSEQKRIAAILDKADAIRRKRQQAIALTEGLLRSTFQEMVGPGAERYEDWPRVPVDDLAEARRGSIRSGPFGSALRHAEFVDSGIAVLGIDNAVKNRFEWAERRFITEEKYEELRRYTVFPGDVLITIMGTTGRSSVVPEDIPTAITTKHLATITVRRSVVEPEFLSHAMHMHPGVLQQIGVANRGAIMAGLNLGLIRRLEIPIPPLETQRRFVAALSRLRSLQEKLARRLPSDLFDSLSQRAFAGEL